jgi:NitT/TauT family transport system substrate-binding protein
MKMMGEYCFRACMALLALMCPLTPWYDHSIAADAEVRKVRVALLWKPQAQFAGYYIAYDKGIYSKHGLDVTLIEGGPDVASVELLKKGDADIAILWLSSAMRQRAEGVNLINIGQIIQRSALMLVAKKSSGIQKPEDLQGRKVSLWEGDLRLQPLAFFRKYGIEVKVVTQSYTVNLFLSGGVDAVSAMWYNEYGTLLDYGLNSEELVTFKFSEHDLNFPEDGIYTLEKYIVDDPQRAAAFLKATIEGWHYAFDNPDEAVDIVLKYMRRAHISANRIHQQWMLARMEDLIVPDGEPEQIGKLKREDYLRVGEELVNGGLIDDFNEFSKFYIPLANK